jgi:hypothetical protein
LNSEEFSFPVFRIKVFVNRSSPTFSWCTAGLLTFHLDHSDSPFHYISNGKTSLVHYRTLSFFAFCL